MPPPRSGFDREFQMLEAELKRLEAEYNQFFAGRLPRLPWDQRARVDAMMRRFDRMHIQNTGDRFRFQTLQSRWASFTELWERQIKAQETGRRPGAVRSPAAAPPAKPPATPKAAKPGPSAKPAAAADRVVTVTGISDPSAQGDRLKALYKQLSDARREVGEKPLDYERFTAVVQAQVKKLGKEGREVAFKLAVKEGRVTLTANSDEES
jgi:hypothetical protein